MTGHGSAEEFYSVALTKGADCYLVKPVNLTALIKKLKEVIKG